MKNTPKDTAFHIALREHLVDEGRHQTFFQMLMRHIWQEIDEPTRLRDLTIEANHGALLESSAAEPVVKIENTPRVVLRGLRIRTGERQHAISVHGACPGLTLEGLILAQPP